MATKWLLYFLAVSLTFTAESRQQLSKLAVESSPSIGFGSPEAMKMFYGNYDPVRKVSITTLPKDVTSLPGPGNEQVTVRTLFSSVIDNSDAPSFVLLTYAVPSRDETYYCHACAPVLGMAVFSKEGRQWKMEASNRAVAFAGAFGKPPGDIQLVHIGPRPQAIRIVYTDLGNGETTSVLQLLIPWKGAVYLGLERVIADDNKGNCGPGSGGLACSANHRTLAFVHGDNVEYYDLELKLAGTDLPLPDTTPVTRARKVSGLEIFKFDHGKYVRTSTQGDITSLDDFVAKQREALKAGRTPD